MLSAYDVCRLFSHFSCFGDSEYNGCTDASTAKATWKTYLEGFETKHFASPPWQIFHQGDLSAEYKDYSENFLFAHGKVAFMSINLLSDSLYDANNQTQQLVANLDWIDTAYNYFRKQVKTIVIFAHDVPMTYHQAFFTELFARMQYTYTDMNFVYVHRAENNGGLSAKYNGIKNLDAVGILGSLWPPLRLVVADGRVKSIDSQWS
jgi:hypothetical protein